MRFTDSKKNINDTTSIQARLIIRKVPIVPRASARTIRTTWVNGSTARAKYWIGSGRSDRGKKVPLKRNIGVMNRKAG